jgi:PAS domain S-box-containing protein
VTPEERRALTYGLVVVAGFLVLDLALPDKAPISGSYAYGAIVAGVIGGFRPALWVAGCAVALSTFSGVWNEDFGSSGYFARLFVACAGSLVALGAGRLRDEVADQLARQQLLMAVADLPAPGASLEETVARVNQLLVPRYAGWAAIQAHVNGQRAMIGARGTEPIQAEDKLDTPLRARGLVIGTLTIGKGRGGADDPEFLRVFAGRVALALDNAGLSLELVEVEQQLQAILENLGEAVTVQDRTGRLVFANPAAAELLGAGSVEELLETPPAELVARFTSVTEAGDALDVERLPGRLVLEGRDAEPLVVRSTDNATGEERWRMTKSTAVRGPGGNAVLAVNVIEDITDTKRAELAQRLLADASEVLASSADYRSTLQRVAELCVPGVADWCSIRLADGDELERVALATRDPLPRDLPGETERGARVMAGGGAELSDAVAAGVRSVITVPMATPERTVGVLAVATIRSRRRLSAADIELVRELARRAAAAIENARLYAQVANVATTLQNSLLPRALPDVPGWTFSPLYLPAGGETDVGGDFYDVFPTSGGWMAVMGDVVGRGPAAASLTAMGRYTLRTAASLVAAPTTGLAQLNDNLLERGEMALCTAAAVLVPDGDGNATIVCAGHPLPYLVRNGVARQVGRTGPLLGAFDRAEWPPASIDVESGDVLVLYTDGVLDARSGGERFGDLRLAEALRGVRSADEAIERIRANLLAFAGDEQDDDTAVLAMQKL